VLRRAAVWAALLGLWLPIPGWAAPTAGTAAPPDTGPIGPTGTPGSTPDPDRTRPLPRSEAFGRWQPRLQSCARSLAGAAADGCDTVLVDQRSAGVIRVSWPGRGGPGASSLLTFVGTLDSGSEPMACRQAICSLSRPIALTLSSVSQSLFDGRGLASSLPSAWPVNGSCRLETSRIHCEARALSGETWSASAALD
jgi:hypothetical protein